MIRAQEARNQNHCGAIAVRRSQTVVDGRGMQHKQLNRAQDLAPDGNIRFLIIPCEYMGPSIRRTQAGSSH